MNSRPRATTPGAVYVTGRAAGSYPVWGRTQAPPTSSPDIIDAHCVATTSTDDNPRTCQPNIGFTVVGDGTDTRILPFDATMLSSRNLMDGHSESNNVPWNCTLCSYENADSTALACSVCGSTRTSRDEPSNPASRATVRVASVESLHQEDVVVEEPQMEASTIRQSSPDHNLLPSTPTQRRRSSRSTRTPGRPSLRKTTSFKQALGTSFAIWSKNDKGPWTCPSCTYLNQDYLHLSCEVCGRIRSGSVVDDPASEDESSLTDYFNSSLGNGQLMALEDQERVVQDVQQGVIERERMYELMEEQARILAEMQAENCSHSVEESIKDGQETSSETASTKSQVKETKLELQKLREELETALESEKNQLEKVEEVQRQRRAEIEQSEDLVLDDLRLQEGSANTNLPPSALDWLAQERMLEDWKSQRKVREEQLNEVRRQEDRVFKMYESMA